MQFPITSIESYFSVFGEITTVYMDKVTAYVVFADAESAAKALFYRAHSIANTVFEISIAKDEKQIIAIESSANIKPHRQLYDIPSKKGLSFLNLNDDCLYEILQYLSVLNLARVARTCHRLSGIAADVFAAKNERLVLGTSFESHAYSADDMKLVLRALGSVADNIKLSFASFKYEESNQMLSLVDKYCVSLEVLTLEHLGINRTNLPILQKILSRMKEVKLKNCKIYKYFDGRAVDLFSKCQSLTKLKLVDVQPIEFIHTDSDGLCSLESFTFKENGERKTTFSDFMTGILTQSNKLTKINLNGPFKINGQEIAMIAKNCTELQKLYINLKFFYTYKRFDLLSGLAKLEKLKVDCCERSVSKFLTLSSSTGTLQYLELKNGRCDMELFESLQRFEKLKVLCLLDMKSLKLHLVDLCQMRNLTELVIKSDALDGADVVELVDGMPLLEVITLIVSNIIFDGNLYERIRAICPNRQQKLVIHKCDEVLDEMAQTLNGSDKLEVKLHPVLAIDY